MAGIIIHPEKITDKSTLAALCPFDAIEVKGDGMVEITAGCKLCKNCVKHGPEGVFEYRENVISAANKEEWRGISVFGEFLPDGTLHPVVLELLGKARELADKCDEKVNLILLGMDLAEKAGTYFANGADRVFVYEDPRLVSFDLERYTRVLEHFIENFKPSTILVGGTPLGRALAPRTAARVHTGLTADCTQLDMQPNTDLDQIRPAFGGNVMAHIRTPYHRPQFATVRYKMFSAMVPDPNRRGELVICEIPEGLDTRCKLISETEKPKIRNIEDAEILVAAGRGVRQKADLELLAQLAETLDGELACSRPLVEAGWVEPRRQIGLSGRTVKPKLLITAGISGSVQFAAGMKSAETIVSINTDPEAPINSIAHYAIIGDLYQVVPALIQRINEGRGL